MFIHVSEKGTWWRMFVWSYWVIIGSSNSLSHFRQQAITNISAALLLEIPLRSTIFREFRMEKRSESKMAAIVFCPKLNGLRYKLHHNPI